MIIRMKFRVLGFQSVPQPAIGGNRGPTPCAGDIVMSPLTMLELCASRQKPPSQRPQRVRVLGLCQQAACQLAAGAASRYALGAGGVGALRARRLRRARSPPRVTRSAHGAARLCAGPPRAAQPLAAIDASRYALGADGVGAARPGACGALAGKSLPACPCAGCASMPAGAASRYALGAGGVGAARPGACGSPVAASRCALGADGVGAARPGACMCSRR